MEKSVKNLTPVSKEMTVYTPVQVNDRTSWHNMKPLGYSFLQAKHDDGSESLYMVTHDGLIQKDLYSVVVPRQICPCCEKYITPIPSMTIDDCYVAEYHCKHCNYRFSPEEVLFHE
jgi:hypothetical protein